MSCDGLGYYLQLVGAAFVVFVVGKYLHAFYQRMIVPAKQPLQFGKWGIITGTVHNCECLYCSWSI